VARFDTAISEHVPLLRSAARRLTRRPAEQDDLVQDTFERALRHFASGRESPTSMRAWLLCVLRNVFVDSTRRAKASYRSLGDPFAECVAPESPQEPTWASLSMSDIQEAIKHLAPEQRSAFELHYLHGLAYSQIAAVLAIPDNTVASRLYRARQSLQRALLRLRDRPTD
jgi:RNA polymerase sigma-70 factor, ECF subfamily